MTAVKETAPEVQKVEVQEDPPAPLSAEQKEINAATKGRKDFRDWEFRPWDGIPHWVNKVTGASTFDLNRIPKSYR